MTVFILNSCDTFKLSFYRAKHKYVPMCKSQNVSRMYKEYGSDENNNCKNFEHLEIAGLAQCSQNLKFRIKLRCSNCYV